MAQNIYDDEGFFAGYSTLPRSIDGLDAAAEWPTLQTLLPEMSGMRVLDLGCGFGWFCRWAAARGATSVLGVDVSARMLERARADTDDARVSYRQDDLETIELDPAAHDLVYSSLTLHYLPTVDRLADQVFRSLAPGGRFVFSVEHPLYTAPSAPAFVDGPHGSPVWPLDGYLDEGRRVTDWLAPGVVKFHRTIGTYVESLARAGFRVDRLVEWGPNDEQIRAHPEWAVERERPPFLLVGATVVT